MRRLSSLLAVEGGLPVGRLADEVEVVVVVIGDVGDPQQLDWQQVPQYASVSPQYPHWEQHNPPEQGFPGPHAALIAGHVDGGLFVGVGLFGVGWLVGGDVSVGVVGVLGQPDWQHAPQYASPVPQYPHWLQHAPFLQGLSAPQVLVAAAQEVGGVGVGAVGGVGFAP